MFRRCLIAAFAAIALTIVASPASAQNAPAAPSYPAEPLLSTSTTIVGEKIRYPSGAAHVTSAIVTLAPGARTILHKHGVPMFAYILDGEITVDYGKHGKRTYRKGQSLMEAMHVAHFGENTGKEPMRLIAVYMGAARAKDVIPVK
jgi:quercetin dioxygenase-like cupin family protein